MLKLTLGQSKKRAKIDSCEHKDWSRPIIVVDISKGMVFTGRKCLVCGMIVPVKSKTNALPNHTLGQEAT